MIIILITILFVFGLIFNRTTIPDFNAIESECPKGMALVTGWGGEFPTPVVWITEDVKVDLPKEFDQSHDIHNVIYNTPYMRSLASNILSMDITNLDKFKNEYEL